MFKFLRPIRDHSLHEDAEDREAKIKMDNWIISEGRHNRNKNPGDGSPSPGLPLEGN